MSRKGEAWNESEVFEDPLTLRKKRRITSYGQYNVTPSYHTGDAFTATGDYLIFTTARYGTSAVCKAHTETGEIRCLIDPVDGLRSAEQLHNNELKRGYIGNGRGIDLHVETLPKTRLALYEVWHQVRSVHLDTMEERSLLEFDAHLIYTGSSATPDERHVYYSLLHGHPQILAGRWASRSLTDTYAEAGVTPRLEIFRVPVSGGSPETIYLEQGMLGGHIQCSPIDPDLLLINRDRGENRATAENKPLTRS